MLDSVGSVNSSNCWRLQGLDAFSAAVLGSNFITSATVNMSTTFTWTDDTDNIPGIWLYHAQDVAASGGGMLVHPGMTGGIRG